MTPHEGETFLEQDLIEMRSEYDRIRARTREDPGTAGDEGEEAWAAVLRGWLPSSYQIRLKGRILGADGAAGPQVDIVVLRPGYPKRLLDKKLYLAGGVAALFECKNTLTAADIVKTWQNVEAVNALEGAWGKKPRSGRWCRPSSTDCSLTATPGISHAVTRQGSSLARFRTWSIQQTACATS